VIRRRIGRAKVLEFFGGLSPCLVGIEACPSAQHWSRKLRALGKGGRPHTTRSGPFQPVCILFPRIVLWLPNIIYASH
jgi:hypothetical protein